MASLCKISLIGNLGRDPELRFTPKGQPVATFSVACTRRYRRGGPEGELVEETEWFRVSAFGRLGETAAELLSKGKRVYVEGRFSTSSYTGRDGQQRTSLEVTASDIVLLEPRAPAAAAPEAVAPVATEDQSDLEDLPF